MDIPRPGWAEQDADLIWWKDVVGVCRALLDGSPYRPQDVGGVALSAIGPCLVALDEKGLPVRPGILYGVDTRATSEITYLTERIGSETVFAFSGMEFSSQAVGPKILWMRRNEPELWAEVNHVTTASSYLVYRLTGEKVMDRHTASHFMPLMAIGTLEWSERYSSELLDIGMLPRLAWCDEVAGEVGEIGAHETGLVPGTPVAVGGVDALTEAISVGVVNLGDLMIMYGSTAFFYPCPGGTCSRSPIVDSGWGFPRTVQPGGRDGNHRFADAMVPRQPGSGAAARDCLRKPIRRGCVGQPRRARASRVAVLQR